MIVYADNVWEPASNTPAGGGSPASFNLSGTARGGFRKVSQGLSTTNSSVFKAFKVDGNGNASGAWELFIGTLTTGTPDVVSRDYLIASSSGSFIDWSATGENVSPDLICPMPAQQAYSQPSVFGRWLTPIDLNSNIGSAFASTQVEVALIGVTRPAKLDKLRCEIAGAVAASTFHLGVYTNMEDTPSLLYQSTGLSSASTGIKETSSFSGAYLMPGIYGLAFQCSSNSVVTKGLASGTTVGCLGFADGCSDTSFTGIKGIREYSHTFSGGGLPTSLTGTLSFAITNVSIVQIKLASP